jgi:hypothetical protein
VTKFELPELPKNYRWVVEVTEKFSGVLCYFIVLERKGWFLWQTLEAGLSDELTEVSANRTAGKLWERHEDWLEAKSHEGKYYGDHSN